MGIRIKLWQKTLATLLVLSMMLFFVVPVFAIDEPQAPVWSPDAALTFSEVTGSSFNVSWPAAADAESYNVLVSNTTGGITTPVLDASVTDGTSCAVTGLTANRRYDIKVTAANSVGESPTSLESLVVTTPSTPNIFTFIPAELNDSNYRYKFQPSANKDESDSTPYENVFIYDTDLELASTSFVWYLQAGYNNSVAAIRENVRCFRLFNLTDGVEVPLDYGDPEAAFDNTWVAGTPETSGDFSVTKLMAYSVHFAFQPDITKYLEEEKNYAITIDPQFSTGGANPNVLGKVYCFQFTTSSDKEAPVWEDGAQITIGEITENSISLSWPAATDDTAVEKYKIAISNNDNLVNVLEKDANSTSITVNDLTPNTDYTFTVTAIDGAHNESNALPVVAAKTHQSIPTWTENATLTADGVMATELVLRWPHVNNNLAGYKVYVDGVEEASLLAIQNYYELYGLNSGQKYILSVKPFNELGQLGSAIETMVVTPGSSGLTFTFAPAATDLGEQGYYHNYQIISPVDLDNFSLVWNFSNGLDKNLRFNLECIHFIDKSTNLEIPLDLGTEPYVSNLEGVFDAGDFKYISTGGGGGAGDGGPGIDKVRMLKLEPGDSTLAQLAKGAQYVLEIDPEFTANNGTAKLGKIFTFSFTTAVDDTEAPSWPAGAQLTASKVGTDFLVLNWPEANDNIGVIEYQLFQQGETTELIKTFGAGTTSCIMEDLTPGTTYDFTLRARDAKSNYTPDLNLSVTTLLTDDQAPTWPADSSLSADNVLFDNLDLNWTSAADNVDVTGYRLLKNGSIMVDVPADVHTYHVTQLTPSTGYLFKVEARDKAGNYSTTGPKLAVSTIDGEADTTPPYWTNNGSYGTSVVYDYDKTYVTYQWPWAADNVAVTAYLVYRNGELYDTVDSYTNNYTDALDLDNSYYTYSVYAVDASGNRSIEGRPMTVKSGNPDSDTYSPVWPAGTNITLSEFTDTTLKVKWTPAQDNVAIRGYVVIKDGLWVEWTDRGEPETDHRSFANCFVIYNPIYNPGPAVNYPPLVSGQSYTFSIKAFDTTENSSKGDPKITFIMGTNPTAGAGIPFALTNVENKRGSLNNITGALNQVLAPQDPENTKFTWEFDEPLAAGYESNFTLTNFATGDLIDLDPADFLYSESNGKGILTLDLTQTGIKLADNTDYVIKLSKTLAVQSGKQLGFDIAWQFSTDFADKEAPQWGTSDSLAVNFVKAPFIATLNWPAAVDNVTVTGYQVYEGETELAVLPAEELTYDVEGLLVDTGYNFKVVAKDYLENCSSPLTAAATTPPADTAAPEWQEGDALAFTDINSDNAKVSWPAATDNYRVKAYKIYKDGAEEPLAEVAADVLEYTITGLAGETTYEITVKAVDYTGNSAGLSGSLTTIADNVNPLWPVGSKLQARDIKDTSVTLYWDDATDNVRVTQYDIFCNGEQVQTVDGSVCETAVTGLAGSTQYTFAVEAGDLKGNKTVDRLSLVQWTAPGSISAGAAFPFTLESPLSHNVSVDIAGNTLNNAVDGSFTKNNVSFTFSFSKKLTDGTWLNNIEMKNNEGTLISLADSNFTYLETDGDISKIKIIVPAGFVSDGQYTLIVKENLKAADETLLGRNFIWTFNVSVGQYGITDIAAGYNSYSARCYPSDRYYLMLKDDGSVWTWGNNLYGTLGDGTTDSRDIPVQVEGLAGITALEAGRDSCFALDQDGAVWGWGSNEYAQLGRGTEPSGTSGRYGNTTPQKVLGLPAIEKLSFGFGHVVALDVSGQVWNWGAAVKDALAKESQRSGTPILVRELSDIADVAAGYNASLAITSNGDVYTFSRGRTPVKVEGLSEIVAVDAQGIDRNHAIWMALKADGTVYIWDSNSTGSITRTPVKVENASLVKSIIADGPYVLGVNGQVSSIAYSAEPQLGAEISGLNNVVKLASSANGGLALQNDGALLQLIGSDVTRVPLNMNPADPPVWPEGSEITITNLAETGLTLNWDKPDPEVSSFALLIDGNRTAIISGDASSYDVLGLTKGQTYTFRLEASFVNSAWSTTGPEIVQTMNDWNPAMQSAGKLAMSGRHTLMVGDDGSVWAWGQNEYGQLGTGNNIEQLVPVKINGLTNIIAVAVGDNHSLALDQNGNVWAWGKNDTYQLGNDSTDNSNVPLMIISGGIKAVSAAADHSIALKNDGTVLGWGGPASGPPNFYTLSGIDGHTPGQLYYGTTRPTINYPLTGVKGIATSRTFSAYLFDSGKICRIGQFIEPIGAKSYTPMPTYSSPMGISAIAAGENFLIALKEDGTVLALGDNNSGQYGNGTQGNGTPAAPRPYGVVTGLSDIVAVAAGGYHGLALDRDGNVFAWGKNLNGQLGNGKTDIHLTPIKVGSLQQITAIGGGTESSISFRNMQKIYVWGNNANGQFGDGSKISSKVPVLTKMTGYVVDIDAPVWPSYFDLIVTDNADKSLLLNWTPAKDNIGVTAYEIYANNEKKAEVSGATREYTFTGQRNEGVGVFKSAKQWYSDN
ncbi:MAG: RCC1 repeat-containing protein [Desulfotomaculum sp. 46_296]|nr:MAG: RCC1 repeat-containing protein [Desulfotomaculum sp. 46_296]